MEPPALYRYQPSVSAPTLNAGPTQPATSRPVMTGYLRCHGKAPDNYQGAQLQQLLQTLSIKMEELPPFEAVTAVAGHPGYGVIKINNIPFTVTAQEIEQFISRFTNAPMIKKHLHGFPIHVIMEKPTGKTMDCFVEFRTQEAARDCVKRFEYCAQPGRGTKIGNRNVNLDLSSQAELMRAVFPRSRLAEFDQVTGRPRIMSHDEDPSWTAGFRGYITLEEIYGMTRFAETPSRSPFVLKCNQRVYESMITTLYKFPWAATQTYTLAARDALFAAIRKQLQVLSKKVDGAKFNSADVVAYNYNQGYNGERHHTNNGYPISSYNNGPAPVEREVGLSQDLLSDLLFAGVNCPGFSLLQKYELCQAAGPTGRGVPLSHIAANWTFSTLAPAKDVPDHVIDFWIQIFDSGFDLITDAKTETTYEQYINFVRNPMGFPVAEWTSAGLELPFEDAIRIEMEVVMIYMSRGREAWAYEKGLPVSKWHVGGLMDLMKKIALEKEAGRHFEAGEPRMYDHLDRGVSPTTTELTQHSFPVTNSIRDATATGLSATTSLASGNNSQAQTQTTTPKFNPATAKEFIPTSARQVSLFEPEPNNIYCAFKSIWSDPPVGAAQPSQASISNVKLNVENTANDTQGSTSSNQGTRPESRMITAFRDPFGPPSHEARGFTQRKSPKPDDPRLDYRAPPSDKPPSAFFNPFANRGTTLNANQLARLERVRSLSVADEMRKLSLSTAAASRNNSTDTALVSTTTDATSYRNSLVTATEEDGNLTPKRMQVQKYPDVAYSNARLTPGNPQTTPINQFSGRRNALVEFNSGTYGAQGQDQGQALALAQAQIPSQALIPFSPTATEKLRTQSTPFAGYQYNTLTYNIPAPPSLEKRGSLPAYAAAPGASDPNDTQSTRGGTAAGYYGPDNANANTQASTGNGNAGGNGQLSAAELWKQVRAYW